MPRGRPREDCPVEELREFLHKWREAAHLDIPTLARQAGIHRSTMWKILNLADFRVGIRVLTTILNNLGVPDDVRAQFRLLTESPHPESDLNLLDPTPYYHTSLAHGLNLYIHGLYAEARHEFSRVMTSAIADREPVLQADALMRLGW